MWITVVTLAGNSNAYEVEAEHNISTLKDTIHAATGVFADEQHLILRRTVLQDLLTFNESGVQDGDTLALVVELADLESVLSGDGSLENVGICRSGKVRKHCPQCRMQYETQRALDLHLKWWHHADDVKYV
mmetsp:Transcript_78253/g.221233  ORF Transcript_78253/g.221233 Transcript_78253/m.221233 type:complete len:131 (-) Transcript_78253:279-671(-)